MAGLISQFHALPEEISTLFGPALVDESLTKVLVYHFPFRIRVLDSKTVPSDVSSVVITRTMPNLDVSREGLLLEENPNCLVIGMPRLNDQGLREGAVSSLASDSNDLKFWRNHLKLYKKNTLSGAITLNTISGIRGYMKDHRFTVAAQMASAGGIAMRAIAGSSIFLLHESK